jgi:membrane protein implicated in regulation of membrane protease activity
MDFSMATWWWMAAGVAVAVELLTGTFYLLMIGLGLAAGALAAHAGLTSTAQIVIAALTGGGATALWHFKRAQHPKSAPVRENSDAQLDIGAKVAVTQWNDDRTTRINYRGSSWTARLQSGAAMRSGEHVVVAVEGNWLVLSPSDSR